MTETAATGDLAALKGAKLHQGIGPNSYRVRIFMAEKGITVPLVEVNLMEGGHKKPEFLKLNSLGQVPVLTLADGTVITESMAICRYLEALKPEPALFGRTAAEKGKVEMWDRRMEIVVFGTIGNVALHTSEFFKDRLTQFPAFGETERLAVPEKWRWLDRELSDGREYLAGAFSVADITGAIASWIGAFFKADMPDDVPNVRRWLDRVKARPSWKAAAHPDG
jgi:glutathione S-transferase